MCSIVFAESMSMFQENPMLKFLISALEYWLPLAEHDIKLLHGSHVSLGAAWRRDVISRTQGTKRPYDRGAIQTG